MNRDEPCGIAVSPTLIPATKSCMRNELWYFGSHSVMGSRCLRPLTEHILVHFRLMTVERLGKFSWYTSPSTFSSWLSVKVNENELIIEIH